MYDVVRSNKFNKQVKKLSKSGYDISKLKVIITLLCNGETLPPQCQDHKWSDTKDYKNVKECHIEPDWLLIYKIDKEKSTLYLFETGTHSELL